MDIPPTHDESSEEKGQIFGMHPGDLGVILIAAGCTIALVLILILPSPFALLEKAQAKAAEAARQKEIAKAVATGEVSMAIAPSKH